MKHLFRKDKGEDHNFWMSYTDLMSGFLVVFMIASIVYYRDHKKILDAFEERPKKEIDQILKDIKTRGNMVNINSDFSEVFDGVAGVEFMPDSIGSIRFYPSNGEDQLFISGSASMQHNLRSRIEKIGKKFVRQAIKLKKEGKNIVEIRIEGHADTDDSFLYNMDLSSRRAFAIYEYIHDDCGLNSEEKKFVEDYMISVGYSYAKTVKDERGIEDKDKSRRIEFRIISK